MSRKPKQPVMPQPMVSVSSTSRVSLDLEGPGPEQDVLEPVGLQHEEGGVSYVVPVVTYVHEVAYVTSWGTVATTERLEATHALLVANLLYHAASGRPVRFDGLPSWLAPVVQDMVNLRVLALCDGYVVAGDAEYRVDDAVRVGVERRSVPSRPVGESRGGLAAEYAPSAPRAVVVPAFNTSEERHVAARYLFPDNGDEPVVAEFHGAASLDVAVRSAGVGSGFAFDPEGDALPDPAVLVVRHDAVVEVAQVVAVKPWSFEEEGD